jgi:glucose/arabinose dehydrogenase
MTRTHALRGLAVGLALFLCTPALMATPGFWQAATQADFLRGDVDQLSIDEHGRLALGPEVQRVFDGAVSVVWAMAALPDGTIYLGTGNDGKVFKVAAGGMGTLFYDSPELEVHALTPAPDGGLYIGTSPDGRVTASPRMAKRPRCSIPMTSTSGRSPPMQRVSSTPLRATRAMSTA